ncbi:hypothetical protein EJ06DRAFT_525698 [Trichodelitschia bisporula]|uniref:Uncharacterized protein n=1 Tax=Trichodelitschia bisporula TaxID=703511 RepID=A0A6G1IAC8_9PEZI|nr:hypothetical protein EJ06DRAFT_525698 [Trichodelitschia bisporula]
MDRRCPENLPFWDHMEVWDYVQAAPKLAVVLIPVACWVLPTQMQSPRIANFVQSDPQPLPVSRHALLCTLCR